jgi:hypothetical protein
MSVLEWSGALLPWRGDLDDLKERIGRLFRLPEPRRQIGLYLDGLIGEVMAGNWPSMRAIRRRGGCKRCWAGLFGIRNERATSAEST